jgi:hypothetical protein
VIVPNGHVYFHRYNHDNYGESNGDRSGFPYDKADDFGRLWPVLSGERGEYELANGRSASIYLQAMADAANDGGASVGPRGRLLLRVRAADGQRRAPLNWAEGQYLRLSQSIDAGYNLDAPSVVKAKYRGAGPIDGNGTEAQQWRWRNQNRLVNPQSGRCLDETAGNISDGTRLQIWDCNGTAAQSWSLP